MESLSVPSFFATLLFHDRSIYRGRKLNVVYRGAKLKPIASRNKNEREEADSENYRDLTHNQMGILAATMTNFLSF